MTVALKLCYSRSTYHFLTFLFSPGNIESQTYVGVRIAYRNILRGYFSDHVVCSDKEVETARMEVQYPSQ